MPPLRAGKSVDSATAAVVLVHGRGANPADMLGLAEAFDRPDFAYLAPAAPGRTWYPFSFMAPRDHNEPGITAGLSAIEALVRECLEHGIPEHRIVVGGFSQGACLASEFCIRHPRRYGALLAFSGGLIGPPEQQWDDVTADLSGLDVFLGCSDVDPHIPKERVLQTEEVFARLGATVVRKLYPGMGHTINADEIREARRLLDDVMAA